MLCSVGECYERHLARGLCEKHYYHHKWYKTLGTVSSPVPKRPLVCADPGCDEPAHCRGMCAKHYSSAQHAAKGPCATEGCRKRSVAGGLCRTHSSARDGLVCEVERCGSPSKTTGRYKSRGAGARRLLCEAHLRRLRVAGDVCGDVPVKRGADGYLHKGYRVYKVGTRMVPEHRIVMEQILGRPMLPQENVHHKNGQRADNRPENLELWSRSQPFGQRVVDKIAWAKELLALYEPESLRDGPQCPDQGRLE
jgi:HNH endonuclease